MKRYTHAATKGFEDKLYWRGLYGGQKYHCFRKDSNASRGYRSLCGEFTIEKSGGQACARPIAVLRCAICDAREMERRGWTESGPLTPGKGTIIENTPRCPKCRGYGVRHELAEHYICHPCGVVILGDGKWEWEKPWEHP